MKLRERAPCVCASVRKGGFTDAPTQGVRPLTQDGIPVDPQAKHRKPTPQASGLVALEVSIPQCTVQNPSPQAVYWIAVPETLETRSGRRPEGTTEQSRSTPVALSMSPTMACVLQGTQGTHSVHGASPACPAASIQCVALGP